MLGKTKNLKTCYVIINMDRGIADGHYFRLVDAEEMLEHWKDEFPDELVVMVEMVGTFEPITSKHGRKYWMASNRRKKA